MISIEEVKRKMKEALVTSSDSNNIYVIDANEFGLKFGEATKIFVYHSFRTRYANPFVMFMPFLPVGVRDATGDINLCHDSSNFSIGIENLAKLKKAYPNEFDKEERNQYLCRFGEYYSLELREMILSSDNISNKNREISKNSKYTSNVYLIDRGYCTYENLLLVNQFARNLHFKYSSEYLASESGYHIKLNRRYVGTSIRSHNSCVVPFTYNNYYVMEYSKTREEFYAKFYSNLNKILMLNNPSYIRSESRLFLPSEGEKIGNGNYVYLMKIAEATLSSENKNRDAIFSFRFRNTYEDGYTERLFTKCTVEIIIKDTRLERQERHDADINIYEMFNVTYSEKEKCFSMSYKPDVLKLERNAEISVSGNERTILSYVKTNADRICLIYVMWLLTDFSRLVKETAALFECKEHREVAESFKPLVNFFTHEIRKEVNYASSKM